MFAIYTGKKFALALALTFAVIFCLLGTVKTAIRTNAVPRDLPIYSVNTLEKQIALTINCAWDDSDIDRLLQLLEDRNLKATFFIVGDWCDKYPNAVQKLADAGHELGSHSDSHPDMARQNREQITAELNVSKQKIEDCSGQKIHLFRPPSGSYNNLVISTARTFGWEVIQWSNDSVDWKEPAVDEMVERVLKKAAPGDILLFHAGKKNTPAALEIILDRLLAEGYRFVTVGELIYPAPYTIDHAGRQSALSSK